VLAVRAQRAADGAWRYELSLPGRPNGRRGWVRGDLVDLRPAVNRIVVHVGERRIEVRRIAGDRVLLSAVVAVGKSGPKRRSAATSTCRRGTSRTPASFCQIACPADDQL
jgi:hypothetical protein